MRVIAGRYKGRHLKAPTWEGLRPTSDKLRETLFNILAPRIEGARVLDGYAGTGAVGIEALSRGAAHVIFVERNPRAAALIASNLKECGIEGGYTIECAEVVAALDAHAAADAFDLILLDPPYDIENVGFTLDAAARHLAGGGLIVLERTTRRQPPESDALRRIRDVKSGDSTLSFYTSRDSGIGTRDSNPESRIPNPGGE
jgi:16S rRNA (guanine966-N2)-methyltransferase